MSDEPLKHNLFPHLPVLIVLTISLVLVVLAVPHIPADDLSLMFHQKNLSTTLGAFVGGIILVGGGCGILSVMIGKQFYSEPKNERLRVKDLKARGDIISAIVYLIGAPVVVGHYLLIAMPVTPWQWLVFIVSVWAILLAAYSQTLKAAASLKDAKLERNASPKAAVKMGENSQPQAGENGTESLPSAPAGPVHGLPDQRASDPAAGGASASPPPSNAP